MSPKSPSGEWVRGPGGHPELADSRARVLLPLSPSKAHSPERAQRREGVWGGQRRQLQYRSSPGGWRVLASQDKGLECHTLENVLLWWILITTAPDAITMASFKRWSPSLPPPLESGFAKRIWRSDRGREFQRRALERCTASPCPETPREEAWARPWG